MKNLTKVLLVVNYKEELDVEYFQQFDIVDVKILNENKWWNFAFKLQKILAKEKYDLVIHWWLCWAKSKSMIWNIYFVKRAFLSDWEKIFDSQKYRFVDDLVWKFWGEFSKFDWFNTGNIVSKFKVWKHSDLIYDFAEIFDIESFWVASLTNFYSIPILTFKGVSDDNNLSLVSFDEEKEIEFLLYPELKRKKKELILTQLWENIKVLNFRFKEIFNILYNLLSVSIW